MISVLVSGQSLGLPENLSPPMPVMPAIVGGRFAAVDAALPVCAVFAARLQRVWSASEAAGSRGSSHLERRPSSLGIDHGWCVYSKPGEPCRLWPPLLKQPKRQFLCSHTKKHANGVHIISPVFTSFLRCSHRFWKAKRKTRGGQAPDVAVCHELLRDSSDAVLHFGVVCAPAVFDVRRILETLCPRADNITRGICERSDVMLDLGAIRMPIALDILDRSDIVHVIIDRRALDLPFLLLRHINPLSVAVGQSVVRFCSFAHVTNATCTLFVSPLFLQHPLPSRPTSALSLGYCPLADPPFTTVMSFRELVDGRDAAYPLSTTNMPFRECCGGSDEAS